MAAGVHSLGRTAYQAQARQRASRAAGSGFSVPGFPGGVPPSGAFTPYAGAQGAVAQGAASGGVGGLLGLQEASRAAPVRGIAAGGTAGAASADACGFVAAGYGRFVGRSAGSGQCVALVQATNPELGPTRGWAPGAAVQPGGALQPGTVIATFNGAGRYANATDGSSHAAIYLGQDARGIQVIDQWAGRAAAPRTIPWSNPGGAPVDVAGNYRVVTHQA